MGEDNIYPRNLQAIAELGTNSGLSESQPQVFALKVNILLIAQMKGNLVWALLKIEEEEIVTKKNLHF